MPSVITSSAIARPLVASNAHGVEAFRAGRHTDNAGITKDWTIEELLEASNAYNEVYAKGIHEAPILHGHNGSQAFGWIAGSLVEGIDLKLDYKDVKTEFAQRVNDRSHPKRSIAFYGRKDPGNPTPERLNIRHVAYLPAEGEDNPAVKGLTDHVFAAPPPTLLYEFAEEWVGDKIWQLRAVYDLFQKMRDQAIAASDVESADEQFPPDLLESLRDAGDRRFLTPYEYDMLSEQIRFLSAWTDERFEALEKRLKGLPNAQYEDPLMPEFADGQDGQDTSNENGTSTTSDADQNADMNERFSKLMSAIETLTDSVKQLQEGMQDIRTEVDSQKEALESQRLRQTESEIRNFAESMRNEGRILPQKLEEEVSKLKQLDSSGNTVIEFGESKLTPLQFAMQEIRDRPRLWSSSPLPTRRSDSPVFAEGGERLDPTFDVESNTDHQRVEAYRKENGGSYSEAMDDLNIKA
ncbi:MAG: hypothetical protein AAFY26_02100 [Cyanobacteria bacterium J06638_22]